jgi:hypothetical protein
MGLGGELLPGSLLPLFSLLLYIFSSSFFFFFAAFDTNLVAAHHLSPLSPLLPSSIRSGKI